MSNDTPSWSGDDPGATPPPPPPPPGGATATGGPATTSAYGGLAKRFGGRIVDGLIVGIPLGLLLILGLGLDPAGFGYSALAAIANLAYFVFLESSQGGTPGKRLLGMSVATAAGGNITAEQSFKRNWWLLLSAIPVIGPLAGLGVTIYIAVTISSDERNQGFHDKMADSLVLDR